MPGSPSPKKRTAKEAGSFIALLATNNIKGEDEVTFSMKAVQEVEE